MMNKNPSEERNGFKGLMIKAVKLLLHNWGFKLLALLLSIALWAGLISQDPSLTREKVFNGVTINVTGTDTIKRNGYIVVNDLSEVLQNASIRADVPQMQYQNAQASYYNARIDLSRIKQSGTQELKVQATNSTSYGTVSEVEPATIQVEVEEYITRYRIPVSINLDGELPEGYYANAITVDPSLVTISGPRSVVEKIARAQTTIDQSTVPGREGQVRTALPFVLLDVRGNPVESDLLEITSQSVLLDSVVVEQQLYSTRSMVMSDNGLTRGTPAEGYEVKSVSITPEILTVAGNEANLDVLDALFTDTSVNIEGAKESFHQTLRITKPSELAYMSSNTVVVAVEIGPVIRTRTFEDVKINPQNLGSGLRAELSLRTAELNVTGAMLPLEALRNSSVNLSVDLTALGTGVHEVPVQVSIKNDGNEAFTVEAVPETITVTITEK